MVNLQNQVFKIVREYGQEIPQSQTADKRVVFNYFLQNLLISITDKYLIINIVGMASYTWGIPKAAKRNNILLFSSKMVKTAVLNPGE